MRGKRGVKINLLREEDSSAERSSKVVILKVAFEHF